MVQKLKGTKTLLTRKGYEALQSEYKDLIENKRPSVIEDIQRARELGDLSENGYYSAAKEKQAFIEGRIKELEKVLKNAEITENKDSKAQNKVTLGSKVTLKTPEQQIEYHVVGAEEIESGTNRISHESPLGNALMGKKVGDKVKFNAPFGEVSCKIIKIR